MKKITLFLWVCCLAAGCSNRPETHSEMPVPVAFADLTVGGELYQRVMKNFDRLEEELYQPDRIFVDEIESNGWPGDREGRTILALTLESQLTKREPLYLEEIIRRIPQQVNEKGYFGPIYEGVMNEQQLSGNGWMLRGLCEYYLWKKDPAVLERITTIVNNLFLPGKGFYAAYPIDPTLRDTRAGEMSGTTQQTVEGWMLSSDIGCVFIGMEGAIHVYQLIPSPELKEIIDEMIACFLTIDLREIKAQTHASLTALRGLIRYAHLTGDYSLIPEVERRWKLYLSDGMTESYENYNWFGRYDTWSEPCAVVDSYLVAMQLWQLTQKNEYLEMAELIYYNGLCHTQRYNGGFGCDFCPGEEHPHLGVRSFEAYWCCTMRGGEGLSRVAEYSVYEKDHTVTVPFFRPLAARLTDERGGVFAFSEETEYPFEGEVTFRIEENTSGKVALKVRIPSWTDQHRLTINGQQEPFSTEEGYLTVNRSWKAGEELRLTFDLVDRVEPVIHPGVAHASQQRYFRGALQYGMMEEEWMPVYHLMDSVVKDPDYAKKILFTAE